VLTLPTPVLRTLDVALSPATRRAIDTVGSTSVTRSFLQYTERPWAELASIDTDLDCGGLKDATAAQPGPAGILEAYATGAAARRLAALPERERLERVRADVERVLPGSSARHERGASWSWDADPFARGGYAWFRPGELTAFLDALRGPDGRLHLAGEHTSRFSGWMQGALESGERAAEEVLATGA
jgi:monoamine oxidase